jgi:hypothetical protein
MGSAIAVAIVLLLAYLFGGYVAVMLVAGCSASVGTAS